MKRKTQVELRRALSMALRSRDAADNARLSYNRYRYRLQTALGDAAQQAPTEPVKALLNITRDNLRTFGTTENDGAYSQSRELSALAELMGIR